MNITELIGKNVKAYREKSGLSQESLAEVAGFHRTYINLVESGKRNITVVNLARIADALEIEVHRFLMTDTASQGGKKGPRI